MAAFRRRQPQGCNHQIQRYKQGSNAHVGRQSTRRG